MQINKISSHPPSKKSIEEFIMEASDKKANTAINRPVQRVEVFPWENPMVRSDIHKVFTVKLPEEYILKIKYFSEKTNKSQQKIIREIICREIDKLLTKTREQNAQE